MDAQDFVVQKRPARELSSSWRFRLVILLLVFPIFVQLDGLSITAAGTHRETRALAGTPVPLGVFAALLLLIPGCHRVKLRRPSDTAALLLGAILIMSFLVGVLMVSESSVLSRTSLLLQSLLPIVFYFLARSAADRITFTDFVRAGMVLGAVSAFLLVQTVLHGSDPAVGYHESLGPFPIASSLRFFPFVLAVMAMGPFLKAMAVQGAQRAALLGASILSWIIVALAHSRTALLALLVGIAFIAIGRSGIRFGRRGISFALGILSIGCASLLMVAELAPGGERSDGSAVERIVFGSGASDENRRESATSAIADGLSRPLGQMFVPSDVQLTSAGDVRVERVGTSENQLGEWALRGGPLALLAGIAWVVTALAERRRLWQRRSNMEGLLACCGLMVALGCFFQVQLTQAYVGPLSGLVLGLIVGQRGWAST